MERLERRRGFLSALPLAGLLALCFLAPLCLVALFSVMPQKSFDLFNMPDFSSFAVMVGQGYYRSLLWSLGLAFAATLILLLVCWPLAYGMARVFGRFSLVLTVAVVMTLFVSENIRLFGWVLTLMKGGLLDGYLTHWFGVGTGSLLYNVPVIVFGLVYVYFPFMLFPLVQGIAMVPEDVRQAAADLGATRWQILREVELPLAAPGILVGVLLCFVLSAGAMAESKLLGGQAVIVLADDVETAFTFAQNWPLGAALALVLIALVGALVIGALWHLDLDRVLGRARR